MGRRRRSLLDPRGTGVIGLPADGGGGLDALDDPDDPDDLDPMDAPGLGRDAGGASAGRAAPFGDAPRPPRRPIERGPGSDNPVVEPPYQPNAHPVDAPIAADLFGDADYEGFEALVAPPDDAPAQVMEDVGQPYTTPFWVPDPPPIPGIVDRFTPPPAQRTEIGSRRKKPDYLAETPSVPGRYQPTPAPLSRRPLSRGQEPAGGKRTEGGARRSGTSVWLAVLSFLFALIGISAFVGAAGLTLLLPREVVEGEGTEQPAPAPGQVAPAAPGPSEVPEPTDGTASPEPAPDTPAPTQDPSEGTAPGVPAPVAPTKAKAAQAAPASPKLHVKSNRRALLYVDNEIVGYAPQVLPIEVGEHRVRAMMPGQPNSEQAKTVRVDPASTDIRIEFTF
jgi:hypothetical protein